MLVQLTRALRSTMGEDDVVVNHDAPIAVNPAHVAAVFRDNNDAGITILRFADGRGFKVRGEYDAIFTALNNDPDATDNA